VKWEQVDNVRGNTDKRRDLFLIIIVLYLMNPSTIADNSVVSVSFLATSLVGALGELHAKHSSSKKIRTEIAAGTLNLDFGIIKSIMIRCRVGVGWVWMWNAPT
jgi:hypothetical protein